MFVIVCSIIVAVFLFVALFFVFNKYRRPQNLVGCRVVYKDPGGLAFGYVSHDKGDTVIVQNPLRRLQTTPISKKKVEIARKEDWNNVMDKDPSTVDMLQFYRMSPKYCKQTHRRNDEQMMRQS
tara:strand:+ start:350 stop:721 length:372 start_codon:yes stop_codon:yes gene_type:complete